MTIDRLSTDTRYFEGIGYDYNNAHYLARSIQKYMWGHIAYDEMDQVARIRYDITKNVLIEN